MEKRLIVEFTGLPASGKSTLKSGVQEALVSKGYKIWTAREYWRSMGLEENVASWASIMGMIRKLGVVLRAVCCNFPLVTRVPWGKIFSQNSIWTLYIILNAFLSNLAEREAVKCCVPRNTIALLDEGTVHRAYSLFVMPGYAIHGSRVISYVQALKLPDLLVYIRSGTSRCLDGMSRRGFPLRMKGMTRSEVLSLLSKGEVVLNTLAENLKRQPCSETYVLEVDGENLCEARKRVIRWIEDHFHVPQA